MKAYYVSEYSILVLNKKGKMRSLYTPFRAQCYQAVGNIPAQAWVYIDAVYQDKTDRLLYLVGANRHPYWCFRLQIQF